MKERQTVVNVNKPNILLWLVFSLFVAVKVGGTSFAAWSWWWLLMPLVPVLSLAVKHFAL